MKTSECLYKYCVILIVPNFTLGNFYKWKMTLQEITLSVLRQNSNTLPNENPLLTIGDRDLVSPIAFFLDSNIDVMLGRKEDQVQSSCLCYLAFDKQ